MKKILILWVILISMGVLQGCQQEIPAELSIQTEDGQEEIFLIHCTEDKNELKEVLNHLYRAQLSDTTFSGVQIDFNSKMKGNVIIVDTQTTNVSLEFDVNADALMHLKKFILKGNLNVEGYSKTDSDHLFLDTRYSVQGNVINDEEFLFIDGILKMGNNSIKEKGKLDISNIVKEYKSLLSSFPDLIKYYNPLDLIPNMKSFLEDYAVAVSSTTATSFVLKLSIPADVLEESLELDETIDIYLELSCKNLLPLNITFNGDAWIEEFLEKKYDEKYLSSNVHIENAHFSLEISLEYGVYSVEEISDTEKEQYPLIEAGFPAFSFYK